MLGQWEDAEDVAKFVCSHFDGFGDGLQLRRVENDSKSMNCVEQWIGENGCDVQVLVFHVEKQPVGISQLEGFQAVGNVCVGDKNKDFRASLTKTCIQLGVDLGVELAVSLCKNVHFDPENLSLLHNSLPKIVRQNLSFLDVGSGTGLWGICAQLLGASEVCMIDNQPASVLVSKVNCELNKMRSCQVLLGNVVDPIMQGASRVQRFDCIFINPPQTGGPKAFRDCRPDKWGGYDGAMYYLELLKHVREILTKDGLVLFLQIGLSNMSLVEEEFQQAGFQLETLCEQTRTFTRDQFDALCPGLFEHQLELQKKGTAQFHLVDEKNQIYQYVQKAITAKVKYRL